MEAVPRQLREANEFVAKHHRHSLSPPHPCPLPPAILGCRRLRRLSAGGRGELVGGRFSSLRNLASIRASRTGGRPSPPCPSAPEERGKVITMRRLCAGANVAQVFLTLTMTCGRG